MLDQIRTKSSLDLQLERDPTHATPIDGRNTVRLQGNPLLSKECRGVDVADTSVNYFQEVMMSKGREGHLIIT